MRFFRRSLDIGLAAPRSATSDDLTAISRLLSSSAHRYIGFPSANLPGLLASAPAAVLTSGKEIWAAMLAGWSSDATTWIRGLGLTDGLFVGPAMDMLLPAFHDLLRANELRKVFYAGDEAADLWIQPALTKRGYRHETDVVVYEKTSLETPSGGNQQARVRRAQPVDLPAILAVDQACFAPQWTKDESIVGPAIFEVPYFVVAELDGKIAGYAFATMHFDGRLIHLVRIAVLPEFQGQSLGIRLMADVVGFARLRGADVLTLNTQAHNTGAQRLYEWFGFQRTGEQQMVLRFDL
jgi:[ribosomal protein S18]-alanine N-acetyltransferase